MKNIIYILSFTLVAQLSLAQKFPQPNQNVKDAFSLAGSIFSSHMNKRSFQNKIKSMVTIDPSVSDPEALVRAYQRQLQDLKEAADKRKRERQAEVAKQVELIQKGIDAVLAVANVDLGTWGNLAKDLAGGLTKDAWINSERKKIEKLKRDAEKELDNTMKKSMGEAFSKIMAENDENSKKCLTAAAQVYSIQAEKSYIDQYKFYECTMAAMKANYDHTNTDWLKTNCISPPKYYTGYQQPEQFHYHKTATATNIVPNFTGNSLEAKLQSIENKLNEALAKVDALIKSSNDAFKKVEYMSIREQLVETAKKDKLKAITDDSEPQNIATTQTYEPVQRYQPLLDCAIRKLALYKGDMPYPEFLESAKVFAEAEIAENKTNSNAYVFLADISTNLVEQYELTGYALYLDKNNSVIVNKFQVAKNKFGEALFKAIENNDNNFINSAISRQLLNGFEHKNITPFEYAIRNDKPEFVDKFMPSNTNRNQLLFYLTEKGAKKSAIRIIQSTDPSVIPIIDNYDLLTAAVALNQKEIAFALLDKDFNYKKSLEIAKNKSNQLFEKTLATISVYAVNKNRLNMLDMLLSQHPNAMHIKLANNESLVEAVVKADKPNMLRTLVKHGLNVKSENYAYIEEFAINEKAENTAIELVNLGVDIASKPECGGTYINLLAETKGMNNLLDMLIKKGVGISARNNKNELPIMTAMLFDDMTKTKKLLESGTATNFGSKAQGNQLHWIIENKTNHKFIELFASNRFDIDYLDKNGDTPLMLAMKNNKTDHVVELLNVGANTDILNSKEVTSLQYAVYKKFKQMPEIAKKSKNINTQGINGWTALHFAVRENNIEAVRTLLANKADPMIRDKWGRTPHRIAREYGFEEIQKELAKNMGTARVVKNYFYAVKTK